MIAINARSIINSLRDVLMPPSSNSNYKDGSNWRLCRGLIFSFDVQLSQHKPSREVRQVIHVAIIGNHYAFIAITDIFNWGKDTKWENVSNHDSCWIESVDSRLNEIYFSMCEQVNSKKAPAELSQYSTLNMFRPLTFVEATVDWDAERNEKDGQTYWKSLEDIKVITKAEFDAF